MMNEIEGADDEKANWVLRGINFELVSSKFRGRSETEVSVF
jgi:hypothetical protein